MQLLSMTKIKVIDMDGKQPEEPQKDFRAELAALIEAKNSTPHPNTKVLESLGRNIAAIVPSALVFFG